MEKKLTKEECNKRVELVGRSLKAQHEKDLKRAGIKNSMKVNKINGKNIMELEE